MLLELSLQPIKTVIASLSYQAFLCKCLELAQQLSLLWYGMCIRRFRLRIWKRIDAYRTLCLGRVLLSSKWVHVQDGGIYLGGELRSEGSSVHVCAAELSDLFNLPKLRFRNVFLCFLSQFYRSSAGCYTRKLLKIPCAIRHGKCIVEVSKWNKNTTRYFRYLKVFEQLTTLPSSSRSNQSELAVKW